MQHIKSQKLILGLFCILFVKNSYAKIIELKEDFTAKQAPKNIIAIIEKVATFMDFKPDYEIAVAKKAGLQINPWNKFVTRNINPQTKNPIIIVNPKWFLKIPEAQQTFLVGRHFFFFKNGDHLIIKTLPFIFIALRILLLILLIWGLGKTILPNKKKWIRFLVAWCTLFVLNITIFNKLEIKTINYLNIRNGMEINEMMVQKTGDRNSAIKALEYFDASIKNEFKNDETFWTPYTSIFEKYANELKKNECKKHEHIK